MTKKSAQLLIALLILSLLTLTGCASSELTLEAIQKKGSITIATSPDFPPFESLENTDVVGIELDIWNIICDKLGVELDVRQMAFDSILPAVQTGKIDAGVAGISIDEKRQKNVLFTDPYCLAAQAIVVTSTSPITCKADLADKNISVQSGTTAESCCMGEGYTFSSYESNNDAQMALTSGKVDAWVIDDLTAAEMVSAYNEDNPGSPLIVLPEAMTSEPYAFAFAYGNEELVGHINAIIDEMIEDGTIASIFEKYGLIYFSPEK